MFSYPRIIRFLTGVLGVLGCATLSACHSREEAPDLGGIRIDYKSEPFYLDYIKTDTNHISQSLHTLAQKYPDFTRFYIDTLQQLNTNGAFPDSNKVLRSLLTFKDYRQLFDTVIKNFPDTRKADEALQHTFKLIRYYDTAFPLPDKVYYFISYLQNAVFTRDDHTLGIGLDMFLGPDFPPYRSTTVNIPAYKLLQFSAESIPVWAALAIYNNRFPFEAEGKSLLEMMIARGKEQYFLARVAPFVPANLRFGYTASQMKWCNENETFIYDFFITNQLLFKSDMQKVVRYVMDGPNSMGMPPESPGNVGNFIGYRIVAAYVENEKVTMEQLFQEKDAQKILSLSKYRP